MSDDWVVVGAGLAGAVCAERLASLTGCRVLVVERRAHVAGNAYDHDDEHGILVHEYGPHIFHTSDESVWRYLSRFTDWIPYEHRVRASLDGKLVPLPFNLDSLHALFPPARAARIEGKLVAAFGNDARVPVLELRRHEDADLRELAAFVYERVFLTYTRTMWGLPPEQLSPSVTARVPVVAGRDDRYFTDTFQALPAQGYTALVQRMLDRPGITVALGTDGRTAAEGLRGRPVIWTGMIDELLGFRHGRLPYRSLTFRFEHHARESFQPVATVNFPNDPVCTRVTEFKKLTGQRSPSTTVAWEYPRAYRGEGDEAYYPIPRDENAALYRRYAADARALPGVHLVGRLAEYRYLNMDQVVASALRLAEALVRTA